MKKMIFLLFAFAVATSCGSKTAAPDAESTVTDEVPDSLNNVEAVVKQVNAVYDYWNKMREDSREDMPSVEFGRERPGFIKIGECAICFGKRISKHCIEPSPLNSSLQFHSIRATAPQSNPVFPRRNS